jgi:dipeptidyl aminopeptidase/acylaminoacyl peptidase
MQDDISDGVAWLVSQGIADRDRVGIYGVGYGGLCALMALEQTPQLYRAGASLNAISDALRLARGSRVGRLVRVRQGLIGKSVKDGDELRAISPVRHAGPRPRPRSESRS